jgi:lysozyme family protein
MADFSAAQPYILKWEGGYVNDPSDSGGETYRGISRNNFPSWSGWATIDPLKPLKRGQVLNNPTLDQEVSQFYKKQFWDRCLLDSVNDQGVAAYFYDFNVNAGGNATKRLQRVVNVTADGAFGNGTLTAVNNYGGDLLTDLHNSRLDYYRTIGVGNNAKFLQGWLNRANDLYNALKN